MIKEKTIPTDTIIKNAGIEKAMCLNGGNEISNPITGDVSRDTLIRLFVFAVNFIWYF